MFGQNNSGDFDQYSLHGVDFGENYCAKFNGKINNLEGEYQMNGYANQLGDAYEMGVIPQGLQSNMG